MNYSQMFKGSAAIDWLEFEIKLNGHATHRSLKKLPFIRWAQAVDRTENGTASRFRFRLDDPKSWDDVQAKLDAIAMLHSLASIPQITAIEIPFDNFARPGTTVNDLAALTHQLYRFAKNLPDVKSRRFVGSAKPKDAEQQAQRDQLRSEYRDLLSQWLRVPSNRDSLTEQMDSERFHPLRGVTFEKHDRYEMNVAESRDKFAGLQTFYVGNQPGITRKSDKRVDSVSLRFYTKVTDKGGQPIPEVKWRTRMEVTLCGDALPFTTVEEARNFDFAKLAHFFKFRQWDSNAIAAYVLKSPPGTLGRMMRIKRVQLRASRPQVGMGRPRKRREGGGPLLNAEFTKADGALNDRARDALRRLTSGMRVPARSAAGDDAGAEIRVFSEIEPTVTTPASSPTTNYEDSDDESPPTPATMRAVGNHIRHH